MWHQLTDLMEESFWMLGRYLIKIDYKDIISEKNWVFEDDISHEQWR